MRGGSHPDLCWPQIHFPPRIGHQMSDSLMSDFGKKACFSSLESLQSLLDFAGGVLQLAYGSRRLCTNFEVDPACESAARSRGPSAGPGRSRQTSQCRRFAGGRFGVIFGSFFDPNLDFQIATISRLLGVRRCRWMFWKATSLEIRFLTLSLGREHPCGRCLRCSENCTKCSGFSCPILSVSDFEHRSKK